MGQFESDSQSPGDTGVIGWLQRSFAGTSLGEPVTSDRGMDRITTMTMTGMDIGREPALTFATQAQDHLPGRWLHNLRWLACSVLTGVTGALLMGGALFIALDRQSEFAIAPHFSAIAAQNGVVNQGRTDRLALATERVSSRQIIQETMVRTVGGKEFVEVTPYARVTASLATTQGAHADQIPEFDPNAVFAEVGVFAQEDEVDAAEEPAEPEAVSVSYSPLDPAKAPTSSGEALDVAEIEEMLHETLAASHDALAYAPAPMLPVSGSELSGYETLRMAGAMDTASFVRKAAGDANSTTIAKRHRRPAKPETDQREVVAGRGDTLMSILVEHGATRGEAMEIIRELEDKGISMALGEGQTVELAMAPSPAAEDGLRPIGVRLPEGEALVAVDDKPSFLRQLASLGSIGLRRASTASPPARSSSPGSERSSRATVHEALYETALAHEVPAHLIEELVRIFVFDVDFQRTASLGDSIEVFYAKPGEDAGIDEPELLFASITVRDETHRFYRFRHPEDGVVDYYDETGNSAKKFLMRKPLSGGNFRSGFGPRRHPILGGTRMHYGVDWSARTGTPIMASGSGTVIEAQWRSGYGNHVRLRHANGYETSYSHMSGFGDGIRPGASVHQGQVVGYVGSTGMSTGPHLHYEVTVNGRHVDPMRIRLPRGRSLEGQALAAFEQEVERVEALMNRPPISSRMAAR